MQMVEFYRRIITNIVRTNKRERKRENTDLTRFGNCLRSQSRRGERSYLNQSIQVIINGDKTHFLYRHRAHEEKKQKL